jgi:MFS transporter, DHA2 family, multidrug resistance protein
MTGGDDNAREAPVSLRTWIAVGATLLGAFLAVLNIQITNTALPYIEGGIATGGIYGTWISTAYLIGEIIVVPLTDYLSRCFQCAAICSSIRCCSCCSRCCADMRTA